MEKKEMIYDAFIESGGVTLTTKELNQLGVSSSEITKLINDKVIERVQRGIYTLDSLEDVIVYGNTLLKQNKKQEANVLFDVCYRIDSNNLSVAFQKMSNLVCRESYEEAYMIFDQLCQEDCLSEVDKSIFLHLFYSLGVNKGQTEKEILVKEHHLLKKANRENSIESQIISCLLNNNFASAQTLIGHHKENKTIQDKFIENTVIKLQIMQKKNLVIIKQLIKEKKYAEAKAEIDKHSTFNLRDKIAFKRILDDKIIVESGKTVKASGNNANSFYQAIETKNYPLVSQFIKEDKRLSMYEELVNDILKGNKENKKIKFFDIIDMLMQNNMESSIFLLDKYLKQNKKEQYKDLVIDFIKASILEEDLAYTKPMIFLAQLNNNNSFFDLSNVLQDFYKSLSMNNKVLSKIYLDIIGDANKLGLSNMNTEHLYAAVHNIKGLEIKEELMQKIDCINTLTNKNDKEKVLVKDNSMKALTPIFNQELAPIYDLVIADQKLTAKTLENLGMSKEKIENLVEEKVLKKVRRYEYTLTSTEQLNNYGKYLASNQKHDKAARCAIKCFEIEPEDERNIKQAFYSSLKQDNLIKSYEIFGKLKEKELIPKQTQNCYLYLFDLLLPLNDKDKNILTHLREEDFYFLDGKEENQDVAFYNNIMELILEEKSFSKAARLLKQDRSNFNHKVTEKLLHKIMIKNKNQLSLLEELVDRKEYETIFTELSNKNIENSVFKKRILKIVGDILELKENKTVSNIRLESDNPIDIAIAHKKYSDALMCLSSNVTDNVKLQKRNGILKNLLTDMVYLMDVTKEKNDNEEDTNKEENVFSIDTLVMLLNDKNISKALEEIENYLKTSNKSEYHYLILDLLKLDILNQDTTFERTMTELSRIKGADYVFDIDAILPDFYASLENKRFAEARVYLDMIINCDEYKDEDDFIQQLKNIVDNAQNDSTSQVSYHIHNNFLELFEGLELSDQIATKKEPMKVNGTKEKYDIVKNILLNESKKLEENDGVIVLSPKYTKYKDLLSKIANELDDIDIYAYGKDNEERILLKRGNAIDENKISHKELFAKTNAAYKARDYEKSLEINNFILESSKEVKPFLLKNIGIVYLKLGKKEKATRLIKIADDMTYAQNLEYHYTNLLDNIVANAIKDGNETKARPEVDIMEFNSNEDNYGIENLEEVSHLIFQVGMPVLEACEKLGFDQEKTNLVTLLCARDCFIDQNDELGNNYLKMVEKMPNKTKKVKEVFQEITSNKKFYKNRSQEKQMILKSKVVGIVS